MAQEERKVVKPLYKIELYLLKIIPMLLAGLYLTNTILSYFGIDLVILSLLGGISSIPLLFIYISSFVFKFCLYHRMFLYYILFSDILAYYDMYIGIPLSNRGLFSLNLIIAGLFLFIILYLKFKVCKSQ